ncbi:MAG: hypothetical protein GEU90_18955 [Gemmatimonas sp.]|nr:hypothetical protein [Gemmatimonas sp.]
MPTTSSLNVEIFEPPRVDDSGGPGQGARRFARSAIAFVLVGILIYGALYAAAEVLVRRYAERNRFHTVQVAPHSTHDFVVLGASHAAVFDYRDMNARLEQMTGARILNLATVGGGITINRLLLEYFLQEHETNAVVYVLDSFAFYSPEWNEDRLADAELYRRAPFDPALAMALLREPAARTAALGWVSGFSKINDPNRFEPDLFEAEGARFERSYRPIAQIDRQRMEFLYPSEIDVGSLERNPYLAEFEELIQFVEDRGGRFIAIRPPIPERIYDVLPHEAEFDATMRTILSRNGAELYDFTSVNNEPELFYDSDHLNQDGVLSFYENHLADVLRGAMGAPE